MKSAWRLTLALMIALTLAACQTAPEAKPEAKPTPEPSEPTVETRPAPDPRDYTDSRNFDFDKSVVRPEFRGIVAAHAAYLASSASARMTLEGHADERGTREYNLGLGERRGNAVSGLMSAQGGRGNQLTTVSYGEERPTCRVSDEECWSLNRRVEIVYTAR